MSKHQTTTMENIIDTINKSQLSQLEMYKLHRHVGNLVQRRMFYKLTVVVPWNNDRLYFDDTDRFEELIEQLVNITIECVKRSNTPLSSLPNEIFIVDNNTLDIKPEARDIQTLTNIFGSILDSSQYKFDIEQYEVNFDFVDPYYR